MSRMFKRSCYVGMLVSLAVVIGCSGSSTSSKDKSKDGGPGATSAGDEVPEPPQKSQLPPVPQQPIVPRVEPPRPEPKPEVRKPEPPKEEPPKPAPITMEEPKPEPPTAPEKPKVEEPKLEPPAPAEKPKAEEPKAEEKPKAEEPKPVEKPKAEEPKAKEPKEEKKDSKPKRNENKTSQSAPLKKAELLVELPDYCATPDGMALLADGSVIVSIPNYLDRESDPLLIKITKDNKVEDFFKLPKHPDTGRMGPMGIRAAPSGDLYLADNQLFHHKDPKKLLYGKSRLMRITMKNGKPTDITAIATGINVANAVAFHDGYVYLTETILVPESKPLISGVYRFKLDEKNVRMKEPLEKDPHLVLTMETKSPIGFGADGICFDGKGNLYVSDFSDGVIRKIVLDKDGKVVSNDLFAKADFMKSCDGMDYDPRTDKIYSADLVGNAVHMISMDGKVETLAKNGDTDGSGGLLDGPCEALVRGNTIVVSNMDFPVEGSVNTKFDKPYTISVIKLD